MLNKIIFIIGVYFSTGCNFSNNSIVPIQEAIVDSVFVPIKLSETALNGVNSNFEFDERIEFLNSSTNTLNIFLLGKENSLIKKDLNKHCNSIADYFVKGNDTIIIISEQNKVILIFKDSIIKTWDINPIVKKIDPYAFCANVGPCAIAITDDTLLLDLSNSRVKSSFNSPPQDFYKYGYKLLVDISKDTPKLIASYNPYPAHFQYQDYYSFYQGCLTKENDLVYGFDYSDTITKVNLLTKQKDFAVIQSKYYEKNLPLNYDSIFDFNYINNYTINQSRITLIQYNPKKEQIYIFLKHKFQAIDQNGVQNEYYDCPFSLIILSADFKKQKEFLIPSNYFDKLYLSFTTKDYLYVPADQSKQVYKGKTLYYRINTSY